MATGGVPVVKRKVVSLIVAGFIALLKVAVMIVLGQTPAEPSGGATEITVGGVVPGLPALSGSLHPAPIISKECQETHCVIAVSSHDRHPSSSRLKAAAP